MHARVLGHSMCDGCHDRDPSIVDVAPLKNGIVEAAKRIQRYAHWLGRVVRYAQRFEARGENILRIGFAEEVQPTVTVCRGPA